MKNIIALFLLFSFSSTLILAQNPKHHWSMANNGNDSQGSLNATVVGNNTSFVNDKDGNAASAVNFGTDVNSYLNLVNSKSDLSFISNSGVFSISLEFKPGNNVVPQILIGNWSATGQKGFNLFYNQGKLSFTVFPGTGLTADRISLTGTTTIADQNWHEITIIGDGNFVSFYFDGVLEDAQSIANYVFPTGNDDYDLFIGSRNDSGTPNRALYNGTLDEIKIYDSAISISNSTGNGQALPCQNTAALAHYWSADGTMNDAVSNLNGQPLGSQLTYVDDKNGSPQSAINFGNDINSYVHLLNSKNSLSFISNTGVFSLSLDFKPVNNSAPQMLLGNWTNTTQKGFNLFYNQGKLNFNVSAGNGDKIEVSGTNSITDQNWHNIIIVGDGNFISLYLDGVLDAAKPIINYSLPSGDDNYDLFLGSKNKDDSSDLPLINASLDDIRIYNTALSANEINSISTNDCSLVSGSTTSLWSVSGSTQNIYYSDGKVSIGEDYSNSEFSLAVKGNILTEGVKVMTYENWPDYVFYNNYPLMPLEELEKFLNKNKHLPGVPSAKEVKDNGINLAVINAILLEKIEELSLHLIDQNKRLKRIEELLKGEKKKSKRPN